MIISVIWKSNRVKSFITHCCWVEFPFHVLFSSSSSLIFLRLVMLPSERVVGWSFHSMYCSLHHRRSYSSDSLCCHRNVLLGGVSIPCIVLFIIVAHIPQTRYVAIGTCCCCIRFCLSLTSNYISISRVTDWCSSIRAWIGSTNKGRQ